MISNNIYGFATVVVLSWTVGTIWAATLPASLNAVQEPNSEPEGRSVILPGGQRNAQAAYIPNYSQICQWQIQDNPCINNFLQGLNFPHPTDNTKFIQCGVNSRPFIIQCPPDELYDQATATCVQTQLIVNPPVYGVASLGLANPCTTQNSLTGNLYYPVARDNTMFIQCNLQGQPVVLTCPANMVWNTAIQSCVYSTQAGFAVGSNVVGTAAGTPGTGFLSTTNPCTLQVIVTNSLYFAHPDPTKFIQCDLQGNAFVQQCPSGLIWNESLLTCASQLASLTTNAQQRPLQQGSLMYNAALYAGSTVTNNTVPYRIYGR